MSARAMAGASGAPSSGAVVVVDGVDAPASPSEAVPATAAAWLEEWAPLGAYTATRTTGQNARLSRWDAHAKRLRGMLSALREHDPASFASAPELPATDEAMRALVAPTVERALARRRAVDVRDDGESMVAVAVSPAASLGAWRVGAHACAFDAGARLPRATCAVVPDSKRAWPSVKDTAWPKRRRALVEDTRAAELEDVAHRDCEPFDEILLSDAAGDALAEGGVTNVFVVVARRGVTQESETQRVDPAGSRTCDVFVRTAPVSECLAGVGRAEAIEACAALGVRVEETTPRLSERLCSERGEVWQEAFLTNATRGVRGVREIRSAPGTHPRVSVTFDRQGTESVTSRLEAYFENRAREGY